MILMVNFMKKNPGNINKQMNRDLIGGLEQFVQGINQRKIIEIRTMDI